MRWDNLFHDLETQLDAEAQAADRDRERDRARQEFASLTMSSRLARMFANAGPATCQLGSHRFVIEIESHGRDWFAGEVLEPDKDRGYILVPFAAIDRVVFPAGWHGLTEISAEVPIEDESGRLSLISRISFRIVLRDLARRRVPVRIVTGLGDSFGTLDRVGQDFLDLARHRGGSSRRHSAVESIDMIPINRVEYVAIESP